MGQNVGGIDRVAIDRVAIDRVARIIVGLVVLSLYFVLGEGVRAWALLGLVPLATGLIGWCPAYLPFGASSCKRGK